MRLEPFLLALLLGACTSTPLPFAIERLGSLPPDRYPALERLAASATSEISARGAQDKTAFPEPYWVYATTPGLDLKTARLHVGPFSGLSARASDVAKDLQPRLVNDLRQAKLFAGVDTDPTPDGLVLKGVVVVADTYDEGQFNNVARTQMELTLNRDGAVVGAMQINSAQFDSNWLLPLSGALVSAAVGSRVGSLADKLVQMFRAIANGRPEGVDTESFTRRYLRTPIRTGSVFET